MRHKLIVATTVASLAIAAGIVVPGAATAAPARTSSAKASATTAAYTPPAPVFGACASAGLAARGAQCASVVVPLDYSNPGGTKISLAISRIKHKVPDSQYQGVMLVNPGGPGGSGLTLSVLGSYVPNHAGDAYDWIGFDPRGVGSSVPALSCDPNYPGYNRPFYLPVQTSDLNAWLAKSKAYADGCKANDTVGLLNHMTTIDSAKDMDSIRAALAAPQINYYGFSYGTYLGQVYATLFPKNVRRMVLDSNVDPTRIWYQANLDQDVAFQGNMRIWWGWLAKYDSVYHLGKTEAAVEARFYKVALKLRTSPLLGKIGYDEWIDTFLYAGYYQQTWLEQADVFANYVNHNDQQGVLNEYNANTGAGSGDDNGYAVYLGVQCSDIQWPTSWNQWAADNWRTNIKAPFETWANAWFNAPCIYWPAKAQTPVNVNGAGVAPILLVDETLDAATPYQGSLQTRQLFPSSSLLALPGGTSHANSLNGNACEDGLIANYLATGALPARKAGNTADATCAPLPQPVPDGASASGTSGSGGSGTSSRHATVTTTSGLAGKGRLVVG